MSPRVVITIKDLPKLDDLDVLEIAHYLRAKAKDIEEIAMFSTQSLHSNTFRMRLMK